MKRVIFLGLFLVLAQQVFAQTPQSFRYQAVSRDNSGAVLANQEVSYRISILSGNAEGTAVYSETHVSLSTNAFGLVELEIGKGTPVTGTFSAINWGGNTYFVKVEMDPAGGSAWQTLSTSQLLSVPYALYAHTAYTADYGNLTNRPVLNLNNWNTAYNWGNHALAGYAPQSRILNINGDAYDLSVNRRWSVGTVESVGLALPDIFVVSNSPVINAGTLTASWATQNINLVFASPAIGKGGVPSFRKLVSNDIPGLSWNKITSDKPTTLAGYGITDAATIEYVVNMLKDLGQIPNNYAGTMSDLEGNVYKTVQIGSQVWMAENLRTTKYKDGTAIPLVTDNTEWLNLTTHGCCWYNNDRTTYGAVYGALYNWKVVHTGKLCPEGWHVPSDAEWTTLSAFLGGESVAGGKMKEAGTTHWNSPNGDATNESGFSALPGGYRSDSGNFDYIGNYGYWWSSSEYSAARAWYRSLYYGGRSVGRSNNNKGLGFSVRCVRD